jgi:hypothetical protein
MELADKLAGLNRIPACNPPIVPVVLIPKFFTWNVMAECVTTLFCCINPALTIKISSNGKKIFLSY